MTELNNLKMFQKEKKARVTESSKKDAIEKQVEIENSRIDSLQMSVEQLRYLKTVPMLENETLKKYWDRYYLEKYEKEMNLEMDLETDKNMSENQQIEKKLEQIDNLNHFVQNIGKEQMVEHEKTELSLFKKVGSFFTKKNENQYKIKIEFFNPLDEKVNNLIKMNSLVLVYQMTEKGYVLSQEQKQAFNNKIQEKIDERNNNELINLLNNNYQIDEDLLIKNLITTRYEISINFINEINKSKTNIWNENDLPFKIIKATKEQLNSYFDIFQYENNIRKTKIFKKNNYTKNQIEQLKKTYNSMFSTVYTINYLFNYINTSLKMDEYFELVVLVKKINNYSDEMVENLINPDDKIYKSHFFGNNDNSLKLEIEKMEKNLSSNFKTEKEEFLESVGDKVVEGYLNKIANNNINKELNFDSFPLEISSALITLSNRIKDIYEEKNEIESHEWEQLEKLWSNHLFKSIEAYFKISSKYTLETQSIENKSADFLLLETINNIDDMLKSKLLLINENRLSDLSVIQRQTKELKKSF